MARDKATVSHLSRPFELSFAAVSKHLGVLERAGLVTREVRGTGTGVPDQSRCTR